MKTAGPTLALALLAACAGTPAAAQDTDVDKLYAMVQQARAQLQELRVQAGITAERESEEGGEHREGREGRERRGEHDGGEGREGRGEHAEGGEGGEEGGQRIGVEEAWDNTRNGAHLVLAYNPSTHSFQGTVENATARQLSEVRVEVHLSNGTELGPTKRTDLAPGQRIVVELSAASQEFEWWTTHPEHGSEEGHSGEEGGGEHGEHGEGGGEEAGNRPSDPALRPLYNQLLLLSREIEMLSSGLRRRQ